MSVVASSALAGASGQVTDSKKGLRFNSGDSAYMSRTPGTAGNRKTWTWSGWVKRSGISNSGSHPRLFATARTSGTCEFNFMDTDVLRLELAAGSFTTTQVFRDTSSWYHIVLAVDTTEASNSDRVKMYVNGSQVTSFSSYPTITQNTDTAVNYTQSHVIGRYEHSPGQYFDGYLSDIHFVDGSALTPTDFGEFDTNGVWQPKKYEGTYGTNGFHLPFTDNSSSAALGTDTSGNSNTWTVNNLSVAAGAGNDSLVDSPTNGNQTDTGAGGEVVGNYATFNPIDKDASCTLSNGNLDVSCSTNGWFGANATMEVLSGKTYFEGTYVSGTYVNIGLNTTNIGVGDVNTNGVHLQNDNGSWKVRNGSSTTSISTVSANSVIGVAVDTSANTIQFFVNGSSVYSGTLNALHRIPVIYGYGTYNVIANFGQRAFAYTAPSGYKALCTTNLPTPTIADGSTAMDAKLYTGNGSTQSITGLGFSPDLVWVKRRNLSGDHQIYDIVRGANKGLSSNLTSAEWQYTGGLSSFDSNGFSVGSLGGLNGNNDTHVGWAWDAGSSTVSNTDGSITSSVRANPSAGFSIVTYNGTGSNATFGHGLNAAPELVIVKSRSDAQNWAVQHSALGPTYYGYLQSTNAFSTTSGGPFWNNTAPTSSVVNVGTDNDTNGSGKTYVAYCFAPVAGYSAFGSYTGNGSADGPMVYTGMKPALVICKKTSASGRNWLILDSARSPSNVVNDRLYADSNGAEDNADVIDFLSNGFKIRSTTGDLNDSSATYIYIAFASNPFKTARAR
jgi:hypothetical protein